MKWDSKKRAIKNRLYLNWLLVDCGEPEIWGLIYCCSLENKKNTINEPDENDTKEKMYSKMSKILP